MAKTVNLTVKVDDTEFKQFVARFNAFSNQIKGLNQQFSQINTQIQKAAASSNALVSTMKALWQTTKSLSSTVASITVHFVKWSTLIGGIGALLGMGGGLFGIDRLAASILQKRKMVLGLGGDYGRTQAAQIFGRGILDDPKAILQNIRMGLGGSPEQLRALIGLGVPFGSKMNPEDVLPKVLQTLKGHLEKAAPGTELAVGRAFGAEALGLSPMDIMRLKTMSAKELKDLEEKIKASGKELSLSEKAQKGWADLALQFQKAKTTMETIFGEKLASLAKPLSDLSDSLVLLVKSLLDMPIVEKMIKQLTKWIEQFTKYLQSSNLETDLKKFSDQVESWLPILTDLKDALLGFATAVRNIYRFLFPFHPERKHDPNAQQIPFGGVWAPNVDPRSTPRRQVPGAPATPRGAVPGPAPGQTTYPPVPGVPTPPGSQQTTPPAPVPGQTTYPPIPGAPAAPPAGGGNPPPGQQGALPAGSQFASLGGSQFFGGSVGGANIARFAAIRGGDQGDVTTNVRGGGGSSVVMGGGGGGADRFASWSKATERMVPGPESRSTFAGIIGGGGDRGGAGAGGGGGRGPLDANNWQSSRTASIVVRNVPGANPYMSATSMAG
jgi:hypothetical protein